MTLAQALYLQAAMLIIIVQQLLVVVEQCLYRVDACMIVLPRVVLADMAKLI